MKFRKSFECVEGIVVTDEQVGKEVKREGVVSGEQED